jgi:hypothetical protein
MEAKHDGNGLQPKRDRLDATLQISLFMKLKLDWCARAGIVLDTPHASKPLPVS